MMRPSVAVAALLAIASGCGAGARTAPTTSATPTRPATDVSPRPSATVEAARGRAVRWRGGGYRLASITFAGNAHAAEAELLATMRLPRVDELDDDVLRRDELGIQAWYWDHGYAMVEVEPIVLARDAIGDELRARVVVREGPAFTVRRFDVHEATPDGAPGVRAPLSIAWTKPALEGRTFARSALVAAVAELRARYQDRGQADVETQLTDALDVPTRTIALDVAVTPGRYFWLGRVIVTGGRARSDDAIAGELAIAPGDLYSAHAIELARDRLVSLGWFTTVFVSSAHGAQPGTIDLHFEVEEKPALAPRTARATSPLRTSSLGGPPLGT